MKAILVSVSAAIGVALAGCSGNGSSGSSTISVPAGVEATQGNTYSLSVFAKTSGDLQPDDIVQMGSSIYVVCQDPNVNPDGTFVVDSTDVHRQGIKCSIAWQGKLIPVSMARPYADSLEWIKRAHAGPPDGKR